MLELAGQKLPHSLELYASFTTINTKPKHESKAREIGRAEVTEMKEDGVEDHRTIELDVF